MTDRVPTGDIERIVGVRRDDTRHYGRAVSAEGRVYILHSKACRDSTPDLRDCPYSVALDKGVQPDEWPLDRPVVLVVADGRLLPDGMLTAARKIVAGLNRCRFSYEDEVSLHVQIAAELSSLGFGYVREARLDARNRIDFLCAGGVGIEVKVAGSVEAVIRQLLRYAAHPDVRELVLVTTIAAHAAIPRELGGKPVLVHSLIGQGL